MFYMVQSQQQKCKSHEILSQFSPKRGQMEFQQMSICQSIFKLESPGFWQNVLFGAFSATKMQISRNIVPVLAKTLINGISGNEHISVNFKLESPGFWQNVLFGAFSATKMQFSRNHVSVLAKRWTNGISTNEHMSVNFQARESWLLEK
jgi:hypothetical protein